MPILNKPSDFVKETPETVTLDRAALAALPAITDAFYQDIENWKTVAFLYKNANGQSKSIVFDNMAAPSKVVTLSEQARADYVLAMIIIADAAGGEFVIDEELEALGLNLTIGSDIPAVSSFTGIIGTVSTEPAGSIHKSGGGVGYNTSARSVEEISSGNGYVEFEINNHQHATENSANFVAGLSTGTPDTGGSFGTINFGINLASGNYSVYENGGEVPGTSIAGQVPDGTKFKIAIEGSNVVYYKNGVSFRSVAISGSYPYFFEISMFGVGSGVDAVTVVQE